MTLPTIAIADFISNLVPVAIGAWRFRSLSRPLRPFFGLVVLAALSEWVSFAMATNGIHNLWLIQIYHLIAASGIILLFSTWRTGTSVDALSKAFVGAYVLLWIVAKFAFEPITADDQYTYTVACAACLIAAVWYLSHVARQEDLELPREPQFWMACGVLLYYATNVVLFSEFHRVILSSKMDFAVVWQLHWGADILVNLLFSYGFFRVRR